MPVGLGLTRIRTTVHRHRTELPLMKLTIALSAAALMLAGPAFAGPAEDIIAKEKCSKCHTATTTKKGPSWASLAEKHKGKADMPDKLFIYLKTGGKMSDGDDHKKVEASDADLKAIVQLVLTAK
jgi:cytochrome c551/c552